MPVGVTQAVIPVLGDAIQNTVAWGMGALAPMWVAWSERLSRVSRAAKMSWDTVGLLWVDGLGWEQVGLVGWFVFDPAPGDDFPAADVVFGRVGADGDAEGTGNGVEFVWTGVGIRAASGEDTLALFLDAEGEGEAAGQSDSGIPVLDGLVLEVGGDLVEFHG